MPASPLPFQLEPIPIRKCPTGIVGFDEITGGGLPACRTTLLVGGPGTGKTVFALQALVNGARFHDEPGIFVAFEENSRQIRGNSATFGWDLGGLERKQLFFLDAKLAPNTVRTGEFELAGLLAAIAAKAKVMNAKRIVFDSLDVLLYLLKDEAAEREEIYRLQDWLLDNELTGILTAKAGLSEPTGTSRYSFVQFMADTVVQLHHDLIDRVAVRHLRVMKYRGSSFADNEFPLVFGPAGIEVGGLGKAEEVIPASTERISSGIPRLDTMLGGGYFRGSSTLISGSPGTAKTTLAGAFVRDCCERGEHAVYFCFDEGADEVVRNLNSVNFQLAPYVERGLLQMFTALSETRSAEEHFLAIRNLLADDRIKVLVIDPVSAMVKSGGEGIAIITVQRLIRLTKSRGVSLFLTSLLTSPDTAVEATPIQISTAADTWIHISYVVQGGERNRALTVVKSRGSRHSNQVRELLLSDDGVTLADVYTAQGQVLMGTARWQKEAAERLEAQQIELDYERRVCELAAKQAEAKARLESIQREIDAQDVEAKLLKTARAARSCQAADQQRQLHTLRSGDAANNKTE